MKIVANADYVVVVVNKPILLADGCLEACLSQLTSQSSFVLAKVLGTLCALLAAPSKSTYGH